MLKVSAPKWGTACMFSRGPCRASVGHDVAVPFLLRRWNEDDDNYKTTILLGEKL